MKLSRLAEFLQEDNGRFSSSRVFALGIMATCVFDWVHWILTQPTAWKPSPEAVGIVFAALSAKVAAKYSETKLQPPGNEPKEEP